MGGRVSQDENRHCVDADDETELILNCGPTEAVKYRLGIYFSYRYIGLPWFLRKPARGPGVAPLGSLDYCQGGTVSLRKTGMLLAVMAVLGGGGGGGRCGGGANEDMWRAQTTGEPGDTQPAPAMKRFGA